MGIQRAFYGADYLALNGKRFAWNACPGSGRVAAATELRCDFIYIYLATLGAKTDSGKVWAHLFKNAGDDYRSDCPNVVD